MNTMIFIIIAVCVIGGCWYFYKQSQKQKEAERLRQQEIVRAQAWEKEQKIKKQRVQANCSIKQYDDLVKSIESSIKTAKKAQSFSDARDFAKIALSEATSLKSSIADIRKELQSVENTSDDATSKLSFLDKRLDTAKNRMKSLAERVRDAEKAMIAEESRKPYTIKTVPFLTTEVSIDYSKVLVVGYSLADTTQSTYPIVRVPKKGCLIKLPVTGRNNRRGASEQKICNKIVEYHLEKNFYDNLSLFVGAMSFPYEPDLAYVDPAKGIFVDIEVDEPYVGWEKEPIHYKIGNGSVDDVRNIHFVERGWLVLRFSESQILNQTLSCIKYIFGVISKIDSTVQMPATLVSVPDLKEEQWWSKADALCMIQNKKREKDLGISQFIEPDMSTVAVVDYVEGRVVEAHIIEYKDNMCWNECKTKQDFTTYKLQYPKGIHKHEVVYEEDELLWQKCIREQNYMAYVANSKIKTHETEARERQQVIDKRRADEAERQRKQREADEARRKREAAERLQREKDEARRAELKKQEEVRVAAQQKQEAERREAERRQQQEAICQTRSTIATTLGSAKTPSSRGYA